MKYVADDGKVFSTEAECLAYENSPEYTNSLTWISNIGHRVEAGAMYAYPSSLEADTRIEVMYNDKTTDVGCAGEWHSSWDTVTRRPGGVLAFHIIAYRIIG